MADPKHLQIMKQGVKAWNEWRAQHRDPSMVNVVTAIFIKGDPSTADLSGADLSGANLSGVDFITADLNGADLSMADLSTADLLGANLIDADLTGANLLRASLINANLSGADLSRADLTRADLSVANLTGANLIDADLGGADFNEANLTGANLIDADLGGVNLTGANLTGADVSRGVLMETVSGDTNLTAVQGLETCRHFGPSTLDHRTLALSWPLPLAFLRGCGLPDILIDYLPSLLNQPFLFYSCFISYSSADEAFCHRLHERLQNAGLRVWFAPHHIQGGRKIHEQIDQAIRVYDKLLLVLSPHRMQSPWVEFEIRRARRREVAEQRRILFPVRLVDYEAIKTWECFDADTAKDLAIEIREYYIPDFTAWKEYDAFETAVNRLLRDLKDPERKPDRTA